jgi:transposase
MGRLDDITLEELYELKDQIDEGKPRERVLAAIGRKQDDQLDTLADRHGVVERTIQNWLNRFKQQPLEQAPYDQAAQQKLTARSASSCSNSSNSHRPNSATTSKHGQRSFCFTTSKRSTASNITRTTSTTC